MDRWATIVGGGDRKIGRASSEADMASVHGDHPDRPWMEVPAMGQELLDIPS